MKAFKVAFQALMCANHKGPVFSNKMKSPSFEEAPVVSILNYLLFVTTAKTKAEKT